MRKEITPEMYNYNKYPGPVFQQDKQSITAEDIAFELIENYRDAFDAEVFGQRFVPLLLKYDYIVGDWGNEQLRLKGFFKETKQASESSIKRVEDYLKEYCNFGCSYFILENKAPKDIVFDEEPMKRRRRRRRKPSSDRGQADFKMTSLNKKSLDISSREVKKVAHEGQGFTIRKKEK